LVLLKLSNLARGDFGHSESFSIPTRAAAIPEKIKTGITKEEKKQLWNLLRSRTPKYPSYFKEQG
jgi:hypothetical protein